MIDEKSRSYRMFPEFYDHPFIKSVANTPKWSITQPSNKMPIDMFLLETKNMLAGCDATTPHSMTTMRDTIRIVEAQGEGNIPTNHAFNMNTDEDGFVLIDIEPTCPASIMNKFLRLPYIYAEKSLSGKGIHMVMPVPPEYWEYPALMKTTKMQEEHRYYEIMFDHWVTFTRDMLRPSNPDADDSFYHEVFKALAEKQVERTTERYEFDMDENNDVSVSDIPGADEIIAYATNGANEYKKTLANHEGDTSKYIYGIAGHFYGVMSKLMNASFIKKLGHEYTPQERTKILYAIIKTRVEDREKNHERRGNTTWLMTQCQNMVGDRLGQEGVKNHD